MPTQKEPPVGMAIVTVTTTATSLEDLLATAAGSVDAVPAAAVTAVLQPRGGNIRAADDGQDPANGASGLGLDVFDGVMWVYNGDMSALKLIASASTVCAVAFYG